MSNLRTSRSTYDFDTSKFGEKWPQLDTVIEMVFLLKINKVFHHFSLSMMNIEHKNKPNLNNFMALKERRLLLKKHPI